MRYQRVVGRNPCGFDALLDSLSKPRPGRRCAEVDDAPWRAYKPVAQGFRHTLLADSCYGHAGGAGPRGMPKR